MEMLLKQNSACRLFRVSKPRRTQLNSYFAVSLLFCFQMLNFQKNEFKKEIQKIQNVLSIPNKISSYLLVCVMLNKCQQMVNRISSPGLVIFWFP